MNQSTIDLSRRRALKLLGAAGALGVSGCSTLTSGAETPVMMDGHVHITNRI